MRSALAQILVVNMAGMEQVFPLWTEYITRTAEWRSEWLWLVSKKWPRSDEAKLSGTNRPTGA
jgi:hypothetical protein